MKFNRDSYLIHGFALLHFAIVLICSHFAWADSLILTFFTMLLAAIICLRRKLPVEFTAISIVLMNIVGFALGVWLANLLELFIPSDVLEHAIATLLTTEIVGWALVWFIKRFAPSDNTATDSNQVRQSFWLILAIVAIFAVRVLVSQLIAHRDEEASAAFSNFLGNPVVLLLIVAASVIFLQSYKRREDHLEYAGKIMVFSLFLVIMVMLSSIFVALRLPLHFDLSFSGSYLARLIVVALVSVAAIFSLVYLIDYAIDANRRLRDEMSRANRASFQYMSLKQQVNPHFLFNSLNVLDALVQDGDNARASEYIHKLAGIYRYMLSNENEEIVRLGVEISFTRSYAELLKLRFQEGLSFELDIREEDRARYIVPCSLQLLVENATKHNAISAANPLTIKISTNGSELIVSNNIIPRMNSAQSTGVGLKYIKQQYLDLSGKEVEIDQNEQNYTVKLPLL